MDIKHLCLGAASLLALSCATPALAVTSTRVLITQDQEEVPQTRIQMFNVETGAQVQPQDDDDPEGALFLLDGGRYRVVVDGNTVREIAVTGTGSETVQIEIPPSQGWTEMTGEQRDAIRMIMNPPDLVSIFFGGGIGRSEVPQTSGGVIRTSSGDEIPAGFGPNRLNTMFFDAGINFPIGDLPAFVDGRYTAGNSRSSPFTVAPGTANAVGFSFGRETDGSTGLILGSYGGATGTLAADFDEVSLRFGVRLPLGADEGNSIFSINPFARFNRRTTRLDSDLFLTNDIPNFTFDIGQQREDRIRDTWFTVGITPRVDILLAPIVVAHLDLTGEVGLFRSRLHSVERNRCDLCGPSHQNFTIETIERDSGLQFRGGAGAGLDFQIAPQTSFGLFGRAELFRMGGVTHPVTGNDVLAGNTTHLERDNGFGLSAGVSMESWW